MKNMKDNHQGIRIESVSRNVFQLLPIAMVAFPLFSPLLLMIADDLVLLT